MKWVIVGTGYAANNFAQGMRAAACSSVAAGEEKAYNYFMHTIAMVILR